ncbi:MAG: ABC transporter substrate-binding protein [Sphaerospermopsis sp. SIO1G2]|nr:ABC transporter substrate-binding protein [Sphaerospermopsis sp. SIO1G2]
MPITSVHAGDHALTLFGSPKYAKAFTHFDYVNPDAPKGGSVKLAYPFTFDSLNPFILKGLAAPGLELVFDTLMVASLDEPQSYYPLIAESVSLAEDQRSIRFTIDKGARFEDGTPITPQDVVFSFNMLREKGHPAYKLRYRDVQSATVTDTHEVTFTFSNNTQRELAFHIASLPVMSEASYADLAFDKTSLELPLASGPYRVASVDPGRSITYSRRDDYWARDLPSRKGMFNIATVRYDIYRDETVSLEAFKAGDYSFRQEYIARNWALAYQFDAVRDGRVIIDETPHSIPRGMQGFMFNLRKPRFHDRRVREAIGLTFDFEWMNRTLFYGAYERNNSFFQNTAFAARMLPSEEEIALLTPYRDHVPPAVFTEIYQPPVSDGSGHIRERLMEADRLLKEAGWVIRDGKRTHAETGEVMTIEFLARQRSLERLVMAMRRNLDILGIDVTYRTVDDSQYQKRRQNFDYDITVIWWNQGINFPGQEQTGFWHCSQADMQGSQNLSGYCSPATDYLLERMASAKDYDTLLHASRSLDRILLHEHIVIPHFSISHFRMAYWDIFGIPEIRPAYDRAFMSWWIKNGDSDLP